MERAVQASIRTVVLPSGERMPLLIDPSSGLPMTCVTAYLIDTALPRRQSADTMERKARAIGAALTFFRQRGVVDPIARFAQGYPSRGELQGLSASLGTDGTRRLDNARSNYLEFTRFIEWVVPELAVSRSPADARQRRTLFLSHVDDSLPPRPCASESGRLGLTEDQRSLFLSVISPQHPSNPFKAMAFRNYALMSIAFYLGLRSGELLGLKVRDLVLHGPSCRLAVVVRRHDPDDTRIRPASQKTKGRSLILSPAMVMMLDQLVAERRQQPGTNSHPYLFVNCYGEPMSDRGLRDIYQNLRIAVPELETLINHILRHDWNDRWAELVQARGWDQASAQRIQEDIMGWVAGTAMIRRYGRRSQAAAADEYLLAAQATSSSRRPSP